MHYRMWCQGEKEKIKTLKQCSQHNKSQDSFEITNEFNTHLPGLLIVDHPDQIDEYQLPPSPSVFLPRFLIINTAYLKCITREHLEAFSDVLPWETPRLILEKMLNRIKRVNQIKLLIDDSDYSYFAHGVSNAWQKTLFELTEAALFSKSPILITGANGTGKELAARWIHEFSHRRDHHTNLTTVDCSTLSKELMGSELFGHAKGAFTGAFKSREGAIQEADKGTLFLDEIGELDRVLQAGLLRVLQEGTYKPVGSNEWKQSDFRLIAATNRNLMQEQESRNFRQDLYYRLSGWVCHLPSLRERIADIVPLAKLFLENSINKTVMIDECVESFFISLDYPGNVRELKHLCERIANKFVGGDTISLSDIPSSDLSRFFEPQSERMDNFDDLVEFAIFSGTNLKALQQRVSDTAKATAIQHFDGNLQAAAKLLGVHERTLQLHKARSKPANPN